MTSRSKFDKEWMRKFTEASQMVGGVPDSVSSVFEAMAAVNSTTADYSQIQQVLDDFRRDLDDDVCANDDPNWKKRNISHIMLGAMHSTLCEMAKLKHLVKTIGAMTAQTAQASDLGLNFTGDVNMEQEMPEEMSIDRVAAVDNGFGDQRVAVGPTHYQGRFNTGESTRQRRRPRVIGYAVRVRETVIVRPANNPRSDRAASVSRTTPQEHAKSDQDTKTPANKKNPTAEKRTSDEPMPDNIDSEALLDDLPVADRLLHSKNVTMGEDGDIALGGEEERGGEEAVETDATDALKETDESATTRRPSRVVNVPLKYRDPAFPGGLPKTPAKKNPRSQSPTTSMSTRSGNATKTPAKKNPRPAKSPEPRVKTSTRSGEGTANEATAGNIEPEAAVDNAHGDQPNEDGAPAFETFPIFPVETFDPMGEEETGVVPKTGESTRKRGRPRQEPKTPKKRTKSAMSIYEVEQMERANDQMGEQEEETGDVPKDDSNDTVSATGESTRKRGRPRKVPGEPKTPMKMPRSSNSATSPRRSSRFGATPRKQTATDDEEEEETPARKNQRSDGASTSRGLRTPLKSAKPGREMKTPAKKKDGMATRKCVVKDCETYPSTPGGYVGHLKQHHDTTLRNEKAYITCGCGEDIYYGGPAIQEHYKKCNERNEGGSFTVHKYDGN